MSDNNPNLRDINVDVNLGNNRSVSIVWSGGASKYRYDIYANHIIQGAIGMDKIIKDVDFLNKVVDRYLDDF